MTKQELPKAYDFKSTEPRIYEMWEAGGYFKPWNDPNKPDFDPNVEPFVIAIPPPNVTGELHIGHPMFISVEDLMIRHARMRGDPTLFLPGLDHEVLLHPARAQRVQADREGLCQGHLGGEGRSVVRPLEADQRVPDLVDDRVAHEIPEHAHRLVDLRAPVRGDDLRRIHRAPAEEGRERLPFWWERPR